MWKRCKCCSKISFGATVALRSTNACPGAQSNHPQYVDDCRRLYDFIFPHDDSVNDRAEGGKLDLAWQTTNVRIATVAVTRQCFAGPGCPSCVRVKAPPVVINDCSRHQLQQRHARGCTQCGVKAVFMNGRATLRINKSTPSAVQTLWWERYGTYFSVDGAMYRGEVPPLFDSPDRRLLAGPGVREQKRLVPLLPPRN
jgi:hypothetical protein